MPFMRPQGCLHVFYPDKRQKNSRKRKISGKICLTPGFMLYYKYISHFFSKEYGWAVEILWSQTRKEILN